MLNFLISFAAIFRLFNLNFASNQFITSFLIQYYYSDKIIQIMDRLKKTQIALGKDDLIFDYIVVGAGVSGLQAAQILTMKGYKILILQAQNQIGGRIGTLSVSDLRQSRQVSWILNNRDHFKTVKFQLGATWIQYRHRMVLKIFKEFGVSIKQQFGQGNSIYLANKKPYTAKQLMDSPQYGPALTKFIKQIDQLAIVYDKSVFNSKDTNSQQYRQTIKKYDSMTVEAYLQKAISQKHVRDLVQNFLQHTQCISAKENSMHQVLTKHARSNDIGILKQFLGQFGHQPSYLVKNGTSILIQRYMQRIQKHIKGSFQKIFRNQSEVIQINNSRPDFVTITALNREKNYKKYRAKKVVCAIPIITTRNITFSNLSQAKKLIIDNQLRTNSIKTFAFFKKPFWRKYSKASGDCLFSYDWALNMCHDISPQDQSCGILVFFNHGKKYDQWRTRFQNCKNQKEAKKNYFIDMLSNLFSVKKQTKQFQQFFDEMFLYECSYMENPYIRSGFQSNTRPGTFTRVLQMGDTLDSFYRDQNNIIFVGSEYSKRFASYIEGAVRMTRQKIFKEIKEVDPLKLTQEEQNDI